MSITLHNSKNAKRLTGDDAIFKEATQHILKDFNPARPRDIRPLLSTYVHSYLNESVSAVSVTGFISEIIDRTLDIIIADAMRELGEPPCRFMYMLMGSEGRKEQTLRTDQDSAIVFEEGLHKEYFLRLGKHVSDTLNSIGVLYCQGNVMASNPKWVLSLDNWKKAFSRWVQEPEPMAVMQACIFFDLRHGYGEKEFESTLKQHIKQLLSGRSGLFFYHMAQNALKHVLPLGILGSIKRSAKTSLDIKKTLLPITDHARIYSLRHGIEAQNTLERIEKLYEAKLYKGANADEVVHMYEFLTAIRLRNQLKQMEQNVEQNNIINPSLLSEETRRDLILCMKNSKALQQNISLNFRGGY